MSLIIDADVIIQGERGRFDLRHGWKHMRTKILA